MPLTIGQKAPDFALYNTDKQKVTLSEQKGKNVLLLFFPLAFTSTCTKELCSVRDNLSFYNDTNATVFGISIDTPHTLAAYKKDQNLNFQLLSDFNKEAGTAYGCMYEVFACEMRGIDKRSAFIIDNEGILQYAEILENAGDLPNFDAIHECLKKLG